MSDAARRKEKQRLKRDKKKAAARRASAASPYKHIGQAGELDACYINANWKENGMAQIHVIRRNPHHGYSMASFLVDIWCAGLKDAFGRIDLIRDDVEDQLDLARGHFEIVRIDVETVRNFVASAIRFSRQNGFRLPVHYDRWISVLGGALNIENADLNGFGKDGKLLWVGPMDDLRKRLMSCSVDDFLARPDVEFMYEEDGPDEFGTDEEVEEFFAKLVDTCRTAMERTADIACEQMASKARARGEEPDPFMLETTRLLTAYRLHEDAARRFDESEDEITADLADAQMQAANDFRDDVVARLEGMNISEAALDEMKRDENLRDKMSSDADFVEGLKEFIEG